MISEQVIASRDALILVEGSRFRSDSSRADPPGMYASYIVWPLQTVSWDGTFI